MKMHEVKACLAADGWPVEVISESTLRSRFRSGTRVFQLLARSDESFVTFAVVPFARVPEAPEDAELLLERLLRLNRELNLAKVSIDDDGDVVLSVEYRVDHLDPSEVRDAVSVLSFYAEKHYAEIARFAAP